MKKCFRDRCHGLVITCTCPRSAWVFSSLAALLPSFFSLHNIRSMSSSYIVTTGERSSEGAVRPSSREKEIQEKQFSCVELRIFQSTGIFRRLVTFDAEG